jgi:hypothetical protein
MARVTIDHEEIQRMMTEMQESFDRNGPIRVGVEAIGSDGFGPAGATTTAFFLPRFLLWLEQQARDQPGIYVDAYIFAESEGLEPDFVGNLVTLLEQKRHVMVARGLDNRPDSMITDLGKAEAQAIRERRADPAERLRYAREVLLKRVFATSRGSAVDVTDFAQLRESSFLGEQLSDDEIIAAVQNLAGHGLVAADDQLRRFQLTTDGIDCVASGVSVNEYLARRTASGPVYHVNSPQGSIIGGAHQTVKQTNTFGFNPGEVAQLATLAALIQQLGPTLGLPEAEQHELHEGAQALAVEATASAPEPSGLRRVTDRVMAALGGATQVTAGLTLLIDTGQKAYNAVFGR